MRIDTGIQGGGIILVSLKNADHYDVKVSSDLDRVLKDAIGAGAKLEKELKAAVQTQTAEKLKDLRASLGGLNEVGGNIESMQKQLSALLQDSQKAGGAEIERFLITTPVRRGDGHAPLPQDALFFSTLTIVRVKLEVGRASYPTSFSDHAGLRSAQPDLRVDVDTRLVGSAPVSCRRGRLRDRARNETAWSSTA